MRWKSLSIGPYEILMFMLVAAAVLLRLMLIQHNWPTTNSDESTMGLMGLHIAYHGEHPIFYYGQAYMGALEAYISALIFPLAGNSLLALRLGLLPFYALFLISLYFLTRLLYSRPLALASVGLLSMGSSEMILHQLRAIGGYPEIILFATLIFLISSQLALSSTHQKDTKTSRQRWLSFGLWGLFVGLALWDDQVVLPCVASSGLLLLLYCRQELRGRAGLSLLLGLLIGVAPLLYYNLTSPIEQNSLVVLYSLQNSNAVALAALPHAALSQLVGALLIALPAISGLNPLCQTEQFPLFGPITPQTWQCSVIHGSWTLGYLLLWGSATLLAGSTVWRLWQKRRQQAQYTLSDEERHARILHSARLMLLASAMLTLLLYTRSPASALYPGPTSRYLICLQIAFPAVLWPLWYSLPPLKKAVSRRGLWERIWRVALLLSIEITLLLGTVRTIAEIPSAQADYQQKEALIQDLLRIGTTRVYSEYFYTCNRLIFQSNERIICSSLDEHLRPGFDRYLPYRDIVRSVARPTYVFPIGSPQAQAIEQRLSEHKIAYQCYTFDGYMIFQAESAVTAS